MHLALFRSFVGRWSLRSATRQLVILLWWLVEVLDLWEYLFVVAGLCIRVNCYGPAKVFAHFEEHFYVEVEAFVHALRRPAEACLARKRIHELELAPHYHTTCRFLGLLNGKRAAIIAEVRAETIVHHWEDLLSIPSLLYHGHDRRVIVVAAVHENVFLAWVAMEVAVKVDLATLERLPYHLFDSITFREKLRARIDILTIQIMPWQTASIITNNDAVGVEHRHYLENIPIA